MHLFVVDYTKSDLINTDFEHIETHPLLYFVTRNVTEDGQLIPMVKNGKNITDDKGNIKYQAVFKQAFYNGLEFRIYEPTNINIDRRITIQGSLHKYWNNGAHNFNDFGIEQLNEVLADLKSKFNILPENCVLKALEIGVNIEPPYNTKTILNQCLLHKTSRLESIFTKDEGNYIQSKYQRHIIKIYDKRTHYKNKGFTIKNEILRFEIKYTKMKFLNEKGIFSLMDLLNYGLHHFQTDLLKEWDNVLICDNSIISKTKYKDQYNNANYWFGLKYDNFKYHRSNLKKLMVRHPDNIKNKIAESIKNKCLNLTPLLPELTLYI